MSGGRDQRGFALISVLMLGALLSAILASYFMLTRIERSVSGSSANAARGFYAAEAGLNLRAETIRGRFNGYLRPSGAPPSDVAPCTGSNQGSADFACQTQAFGPHAAVTYVSEDAANPVSMVIPPGEPHENLNAQRYAYTVESTSFLEGSPESILTMELESRVVPMFQFAAFYNKDLEIHPGPAMTLGGPVHSNGDLYLGSSGGLDITGQVTTAGRLYQGTKTDLLCYPGGVRVPDPGALAPLGACPGGALTLYDQPTLDSGWNGMIRTQVAPLTIPQPESFDAQPGSFYWDNADARIVLKLDGATDPIELRNADGTVDAAGSAVLTGCGPVGARAVDQSSAFFNLRESRSISMLEVDLAGLLDCLHQNPGLIGGRLLDDDTGGGLVWFLSVDGPDSNGLNGYGVRVSNGGTLASTLGTAPPIRGLTVVTDQAAYTHGNYNAGNTAPAAIMADSLNVLSGAYVDGDHAFALGDPNRDASATTINAAFLAGTDVTGGIEGPGGQGGDYNGGLENYPRLHERWSGVPLVYRGSFVSLGSPEHVSGPHTTPDLYSPPIRDWGYDANFNNAANLPPLTPRFVYLRQALFAREFEQ